MYDLKFVDRTDSVPHRSFRVQCDSYHMEQVTVKKGENLEKYSPSIAETSFPFEDDSRWKATEQNEQVLIVNVAGAKGYKYIDPPLVITLKKKTIEYYSWIKEKFSKSKKKKKKKIRG